MKPAMIKQLTLHKTSERNSDLRNKIERVRRPMTWFVCCDFPGSSMA